ncbi:unnamed protein product [Caenorhabditis angaria]|uniref:CC domain-containing protein n=1 Tax=Caenorhabditis angaria TaxID=860376 RepID=A0A9P1J4D9_9PELO|nr:unnamed protein product [Caenorhabditis angaria]
MMMNTKLFVLITLIASCFAALTRDEIFQRAVGPCINDNCQSKHVCYYGQCVPEGISPPMAAIDLSTAVGKCQFGGLCTAENTFCHQGNCYPF